MGLGRILLYAGLVLVAAGLFVLLLERANIPLGRLPGDVVWRRGHTTVYFPWVTCLVISIFGTFLLWLITRGR